MTLEEFEKEVEKQYKDVFICDYHSRYKEKLITLCDQDEEELIEVYDRTWQRAFLKALILLCNLQGKDPQSLQLELDLLP